MIARQRYKILWLANKLSIPCFNYILKYCKVVIHNIAWHFTFFPKAYNCDNYRRIQLFMTVGQYLFPNQYNHWTFLCEDWGLVLYFWKREIFWIRCWYPSRLSGYSFKDNFSKYFWWHHQKLPHLENWYFIEMQWILHLIRFFREMSSNCCCCLYICLICGKCMRLCTFLLMTRISLCHACSFIHLIYW